MPPFKKLNIKVKPQDNSGFGASSAFNTGRFVNKDGKANIVKSGIPFFERYSIYHSLLDFPRWKFALTILGFFISINIVFASFYYTIGVDKLGGVLLGSPLQNFAEAFFFSAQTFTTVGYGRINPSGFLDSTIAAMEALTGLLSFAVVTGLFYGRFSRPRAFLKFSENMVVAPYKNATALMFRLVPYKNNQLTEAEVKITIAMTIDEEGKQVNKFYPADVEISKINSLTLSWTLVHALDERSPLYNFTLEDMQQAKVQVLIFVKAFDEAFSTTVVARSSYISDEIIYGAKFTIMYEANEEGTGTILYINRLNDIEKAELPLTVV
ncbi:MAG: ion channel [Chitinophagaceae bacterium]